MTLIHSIRQGGPGEALRREEDLLLKLREAGRILVAFSGGIDSGYLAYAAHKAVGERALAVTAVSESLAPRELEQAKVLARHIGIEHRLITTREMDNPLYRQNRGDRCYHCKEALFTRMLVLQEEFPDSRLAYGAIPDDLGDDRPGMDAAREAGAWAPLLEAGMSKALIRERARAAGLPVWDKPASACLASRIPVGQEVTAGKLTQVGKAEAFLHDLGLRQVRVRHEGHYARIEVPAEDMAFFADSRRTRAIDEALREIGFERVVLDLKPYRNQASISGE